MYPITTCPNAETLRKYLLGRIHGDAARQLDAHFESCPDCLENAASIDATDELVNQVSSSAKLPLNEDQFCADATEMAHRILSHRSNADTQTSDQTLVTPGRAPEPPADPSEAIVPSDEALRVLRRSFTKSHDGSFDQLGNYRVHEVIGVGGMGFVFRAEDERLQRPIALKVMRPHLAAQQFERERFLREARAAAAIDHDHVAAVYDVGEVNGIPYIAMPLLQGETLKQRLNRETQLPESEVLRIGMETASGLAAAHTAGLIHRDIKPDNLWLEAPSGRVKILDFGLVRPTENDAELTHDGAIMGTPRYMAPEQATAMPVDHRCDLFSLGATLYRAATGTPAFSGASPMECMSAVMTQSEEPAYKRSENVSRNFSAALSALLQKNPDQRPQSAEEVLVLLSAIDGIRNDGPRNKLLTGLGAATAVVLLLGVVITIKYKDGTSTSITVSNSKGSVPPINVDASSPQIEAISISDEDKASAHEPEVSDASKMNEKALVQRLMKMGAAVEAENPNGVIRFLKSHKEFTSQDFLIGVNFSGTNVHDDDVALFRNLRTLRAIYLHDTQATSQVLHDLKNLPRLHFVRLGMPVTPEVGRTLSEFPALDALHLGNVSEFYSGGLRPLVAAKQLRILTIGGGGLRDDEAAEVADLNQLHYLGVDNATHLGAETFRQVARMPNLGKLGINGAPDFTAEIAQSLLNSQIHTLGLKQGTTIEPEAISRLSNLKRLNSLEFYQVKLPQDVTVQLATLTKLKQIRIHDCEVTPDQIASLRKALPGCQIVTDVVAAQPPESPDVIAAAWLKQVGSDFKIRTAQGRIVDGRTSTSTDFEIVEIRLEEKSLKGEDLHNIVSLSALIKLELTGDLISEIGCEHVSRISSLRFLDLLHGTVDESSMLHIARLPSLERIGLVNVALDASAMAALTKAPKLLGITLAKLSINDSDLAPLANLTSLRELGIADCAALTSDSLRHVRRVAGLRDLYLIRLPGVGNALLSFLNGHPNLHRLGFLDVPIDDEAFQDSLSFPKLFWISFEDTEVSSVGIDRLTRLTMPALQQLQLGSLEVANDCLLPASAWSQLRNFSLTHTTLDSERIMQLSTLKSLNQLRLIDVTIKEMDKETLRQALPNCEIRFD